jgi:hypothetical protein
MKLNKIKIARTKNQIYGNWNVREKDKNLNQRKRFLKKIKNKI